MDKKSKLFKYPLSEETAKFEYRLLNPNGKLSDIWLHEEYQKLSLSAIDKNSRKRNAGDDDVYDQKNMPSCDDTASSDTDCQSQVSSTAHLHSYRSNGLVEPPSKRRLTTTNETSLSSAGATTFQIESPGTFTTSKDSKCMNSPTHTPISDIEEDPIQQLPLPSPSASPIQSDTENEHVTTPDSLQGKANLDSIENVMSNEPTTQSELVDLVTKLSGFLSEANQNHLVFKLLQKTTRPTLSTFNNLINNSLKRDILSNVPFEVCKKWDKLITDDAVIKYELQYPDQLLREWSTLPEINSAQVLYKKRKIIVNRWMDPKFKPHRISVSGHGNKVVTCLQHDDEKVVTGVDDKCILIYSTQTGQLMKVLEGHEGGVWALKYTGNTLVTGSTDRTVRVWNMKTGQCTHIFRGHTSTIRCLDIIHPAVIGKNQDGEDIVFPEYPLLITGSRDHNIHVWKLPVVDDSQDYIETFEGEFDNPYLIAVLSGHTQSVRSISGYGNIIISGSYDSTVRVWDLLDDGHCTHVLQGHLDRVYSTAIDFHSKTCFSGSMDSNINVWNFETGELKKVLVGHASLVGLLDLVDDVLVSAAADATLRIWDAKTGELRSKLKGHGAAITCFEHDGLRVVSGSEKMLKLWNVEKGTFARDLLSDVTGGIWQVRFDYKRCVAAVQRIINEDEGETFIEILDFSQPLLQ
ncbi:WD domain, G-beta repeat family protein [Candida albicans]|uniref:WD domain, G-beta repeat family protein n=1 Tax=Candida albicans TaxID=5476 RepID=A0A8H6F659_CANAX|nr:WD domain, G-beta repeat family protein [Candida albicans]